MSRYLLALALLSGCWGSVDGDERDGAEPAPEAPSCQLYERVYERSRCTLSYRCSDPAGLPLEALEVSEISCSPSPWEPGAWDCAVTARACPRLT